MRQTLQALQAAHGAGIIHRDLKPDNIFVLREKAGHSDYVKLIDFGISKFAPTGGDVAARMTQAGALMGTPDPGGAPAPSGARPRRGAPWLPLLGVLALGGAGVGGYLALRGDNKPSETTAAVASPTGSAAPELSAGAPTVAEIEPAASAAATSAAPDSASAPAGTVEPEASAPSDAASSAVAPTSATTTKAPSTRPSTASQAHPASGKTKAPADQPALKPVNLGY